MSKLKNWIIQHQVASFFILAFLITWPGFFMVFFIFPGNQIVEIIFSSYITFGPALSAMLISGLAKPGPRAKRSRARWIVFGITWVIASLVQILYCWRIQHMNLNPAVIIICCIFGLFPAWVLSSAYARTPGIREHFSTLLKPRGPVLWYLVIFLIFPGMLVLAFFITRLFGGEAEFYLSHLGFNGTAEYLILEFLRGFLMTGGINAWKSAQLPTTEDKRQPLPIMRQVQIVAGTLILTGVVLGYTVNSGLFLLSGFIGAGLLFAGVSGWCGMAMLLSKMPWNRPVK